MATEIEGSEPITMADLAQLLIDLHAKMDLILEAMQDVEDEGNGKSGLDGPAPNRDGKAESKGLG